MKLKLSLFVLMIVMQLLIHSDLQGQSRGPKNFKYTGCGCDGSIDLTIHNGLYGNHGSQKIAEGDEIIKWAGAIADLQKAQSIDPSNSKIQENFILK